jgi:general secretion pathway protein H
MTIVDRAWRGTRWLQRGLTLIELMVVIAIMAILIAAGAVGIAAIRGADIDATGKVVAGAMTYLSSRAVHDNKTYRLVLDLDQKRFWSETTNSDDPCARFVPEDADAGLSEDDKEAAKERAAEAAKAEDGEAPAEPAFAQKKDALLQKQFEPGTNVTAVLTSHHTAPQTEGRAVIYFYPNGQAERALVWIGGKNDESPTGWAAEITIELHSLGRVTFHSNPVDEGNFDLSANEDLK